MTYNGHTSYNAWNVSLWLNNDVGLYYAMKGCLEESPTKDAAAIDLLNCLHETYEITHTPDGVPFTKSTIRAAMVGL